MKECIHLWLEPKTDSAWKQRFCTRCHVFQERYDTDGVTAMFVELIKLDFAEVEKRVLAEYVQDHQKVI